MASGQKPDLSAIVEERGGGDAVNALKRAGELECIDAQFVRDLPDQLTGGLQAISGPLHLETLEITKRCLVLKAAEEPAEIGHVDVAGGGGLVERVERAKMGVDVLAAAFEGRERAAVGVRT